MVEFKIKSLDEYKKVIDYIIKKKSKIILFSGDLGSGKTTLIQLICKKLHVKENVLSPTFNLINEYRSEENIKIYHFDLYRINSIQDLIDIDFIEYLDSGNYCFIEWPNICKDLIKEDYTEVFMNIISKNKRLIKIN